MNNTEVKRMAIKNLNTKPVQNIKKQLCRLYINEKEKRNCSTIFDKSFIKSFIHSYHYQ
jgi:hypothetical protein